MIADCLTAVSCSAGHERQQTPRNRRRGDHRLVGANATVHLPAGSRLQYVGYLPQSIRANIGLFRVSESYSKRVACFHCSLVKLIKDETIAPSSSWLIMHAFLPASLIDAPT